jgi:hypothetical protein
MAFRSVVSCRPFISALVIASAAGLVGCGDDGASPPADVPDSGADAATTPTTKPTGTVKPTATPTGTQAPTAKPSGTPVDTDAGPDAEVPGEPDAATSASPDSGPLTPETGPAPDSGPVVTPDAAPGDGAVLPPVDAGPTDGGQTDGGGTACFDGTRNDYLSETDFPCAEAFGNGCESDAGTDSSLPEQCGWYQYVHSKGVFESAMECFAGRSGVCAVDALEQFDTCFAEAAVNSCTVSEAGCDTLETGCGEITSAQCNAHVARFSSEYLEGLAAGSCYEITGDGCGELFVECTTTIL